MSEKTCPDVAIQYNPAGDYYAAGMVRDGAAIWLSVATYPLPVPEGYRRPHTFGCAIMRGRDYYRMFTLAPLMPGRQTIIAADNPLITDYRDAAWWTPGLEEAWAECAGLHLAISQHEKHLADEKSNGRKRKD